FHTGGIGSREIVESEIRASIGGSVELRDCNEVATVDEDGNPCLVSLKRNGEIAILDPKGRELEKHKISYGAYIMVKPGEEIKRGQQLVRWNPHSTPILAEKDGKVRHIDIEIGETVREEDAGQGQKALVVIEHKGEKHPQIVVEDDAGNILDFH